MADIERLVVGPLASNCYIFRSGHELAVIDPGGDAERILEKLREPGGKVRYVINTHGHIDHVAADQDIIVATGAELLIHQDDAVMLEEPDNNLSGLIGLSMEPISPSRRLADGDKIIVGHDVMKVLHTPGHTPGGVCLIGNGFAFTGDTLFLESIGRTDLPASSEQQMRASLDRLRAVLSKKTVIYPGHGESGLFSRALLVNPFLGDVWPA